jgi:glutamyl-tRNA synthetase
LGNARTFLVNWLLARQNGWSIFLRIDDLDGPRVKRGADQQAMEDLRWLGMDWDRGPIYQSNRMPTYKSVIDRLLAERLAYPCICSRREAQMAASAPHMDDGSHRYPGTCRGRFDSVESARKASRREPSIRFKAPAEIVRFTDRFMGDLQFDAAEQIGDFVIAKADGTPAYQLAVVVDDSQMQITHVVRGADLLESTARQILLYRALGLEKFVPEYIHLPLVLGPDQHRLAKRHGDSRLSYYRSSGVSRASITALLARWCGISESIANVTPHDLIEKFRLSSFPREPIIYTKEEESQLMNGGKP